MCTFTGIIERALNHLPGHRILYRNQAIYQVTFDQLFAIGEFSVKKTLASRNIELVLSMGSRPDLFPLAAIQFHPPFLRLPTCVSVDFSIQVTDDRCVGFGSFPLGQNGCGSTGFGVQRDDLAGRAAYTNINPTHVICRNGAWILSPVLVIKMAIVSEYSCARVIRDDPAVGIGSCPDPPLVILCHAHCHLRC